MCRLLLESGGALLLESGGNHLLEQCDDATNSGVERLRAAHHREVTRKQALQVQHIRLAELQQQQRELEAQRLTDEALRKAAETQKPREDKPALDTGSDDKISALVRELADLSGAVSETQAAIAKLEAAEDDDETMIMLLLGQSYFGSSRTSVPITDDEIILILAASI